MSKKTAGQVGGSPEKKRMDSETTDRPYEAADRCQILTGPQSTPVEKVETMADVDCQDCESEPVRAEYKGDQVLRCSDCDAILVRDIKS